MTIVAAFSFVIINSVIANLLLKMGGNDPRSPILLNFLSWRSFLGLCFFGVGGLAYSWAVRLVPLYVAQSIMSIQYLLIMAASVALLGESMTPLRFIGVLLIAGGVFVISISYAPKA